jgi:diguanylate cyclase (GGDEF)-like protein
MFELGAAALMLAAVLAAASIPRRGRDLGLWIAALVLAAGADFLISQHDQLGAPSTIVLTATLISVGLALVNLSIRDLLGEDFDWFYPCAPVLLAGCAALVFADDRIVRSGTLDLVYAGQAAQILVLLLSSPLVRRARSLQLLSVGVAILLGIFTARVTVVLYRPEILASSLHEGSAQTVTLLLGVVGIIVASLAFMSARRARYEEGISAIAATDSLTGVFNRHMLMDLGARELARADRSGQSLSVLMLDFDHLRQVNERHGRPAGDRLLRAVAETISGALRECDVMARHDGEEFCIVLPDAHAAGADVKANRIRLSIAAKSFPAGGQACKVTLSVGVATYLPGSGESFHSLVKRAHAAMGFAKRNGRNQVGTSAPVDGLPGRAVRG